MDDTNTSTSSTPTETVASTAAPESVSTSTPETSQPRTWSEAFEQAGVTGDPQQTEAAEPTPAPATAEPDATALTATSAKGPIPLDRHEAILQNTRQKTAQEVVARVEQQFGPAIQLQQRLNSDPLGTLSQLIEEAVQHPEYGASIVSHLARTLGSRRKAAEAIQPIDTEIGKVYTADQMQAVVDQKLAERLGPLEQERQTRVAQEMAAQERARTVETVQNRLGQWREQPGFTEHEAVIQQHQKALVAQGLDPWNALGIAYAKVVQEKVVPQLKADTTKSFVQQAAQKAAASSPDPARVAPILPGRPKSWAEAFRQQGLQV